MKIVPKTTANYLGIDIDYKRDSLLSEQGKAMLSRKGFYKKEHERSPQQSFARAASCYSFGDDDFAQRIYEYASKGWFTFASPVLSNAVEIEWKKFEEYEFDTAADWLQYNVRPDGMPISCFLSYIGDTKESLVESRKETAWLSMMGGGIGVYCGNRSPDEKSTGVMAHMRGYDADTLAYKQTSSRRGSMAAYLDIDHPEIIPFLEMRNPVGGDSNKKCFNLNNAVNLTDAYMEAVINGESYELIDPKHGATGQFLDAREVFEKIMVIRKETGEPYIMYKDTVNREIPEWITRPIYEVKQSNLCSEITLATSDTRTAVCCLSSLNLEKYEEWKDTNIVQDVIRLLDNVLEFFIRLAPPELHKAVNSATKERSLGLGTLGWSSFLQSKSIPFESGGVGSAIHWTSRLYKTINKRAKEESLRLGALRGEAPDCDGSGMRNAHLMAIAPNASSSAFFGTSPSIEPWNSNAFNAQGRAGSFLIKNVYLEKVLIDYGMNNANTWRSIITNEGSVQHLDFLTDHEKKVFKTAFEMDQRWIIEQAAIRQRHICQSQSLNLFVQPDITADEMANLHITAWLKGVKTLYYCRSKPTTRAKVGDGTNAPLNAVAKPQLADPVECLACEG